MGKSVSNSGQELVSAGGIVYRQKSGNVQVVVCGREDPQSFNLPKGTPNKGETIDQTALREVQEETGLEVVLEDYVGSIRYEFLPYNNGHTVTKTVFYYLMDAVGGDFSLHDSEFDTVRWVGSEEIPSILSFGNEVEIVQKGISMVKKRPEGTSPS